LTVGNNGNNGTFSGTIQNSAGALSLTKVGAGTQTFSGAYMLSGTTLVAGGTVNVTTATGTASTPGSFIISNGATFTANTSLGNPLPANNVVIGTNASLSLTLSSTANGINASGNLTLQDNATNNFAYSTITANPTIPVINLAGGISAPGSNIVINITATGLRPGPAFPLIKYTGTALASIANFSVNPPPGVAATLVNNTGNHSIDLQITSTPNSLAWNGLNGTGWDLATANWTNLAGGITVFQQYTNGSVVAGDAVLLDDTLTNDLVNPQPTNITLNARFFAFPFVVNSTLPMASPGRAVSMASLPW